MKSNSEGLIIDGVVAHIDRDNIDTDQIIPTEYLKSIKKFGFGEFLFDGWRYHDIANINTPTSQKKELPDGMWYKTPGGSIVHIRELKNNSYVCPEDDHHVRIGSKEYFEIELFNL